MKYLLLAVVWLARLS